MLSRIFNAFRKRESVPESQDKKWLDAPEKIDIVSAGEAKVTCWLIVNYPWSLDTTYAILDEKLNHYVWFIRDGQLEADYPATASKKPVICIESMYPLTERIARLLPSMKVELLDLGIELEVMIADEENTGLTSYAIEP